MKCIVFTIPDSLSQQIGMEGVEEFMKNYIVTENGNLMVPWYEFIDEKNCDDELTVAVVNDVEYYDAQELMKFGKKEYRDVLKQMVRLMITFHRDRFDQQKEKAIS